MKYTNDNTESIAAESAKILKGGGVIAYSTESFYALGVVATDNAAVKRLFELKKRPHDKPVPIIISDINMISSIAKSIPAGAVKLMDRFWPGPMTLIFESLDNIPAILTGNTGRVAVRIPGESAALDLVRALKFPITATSANISAQPPAVDADTIIDYFGDSIDLIIDSGTSPGGRPSTIVDVTVTPPKILREGSILPDLQHFI